MDNKNNSALESLQKTSDDQANTIAKLENEIKKLGDSNSSPRIIQRGKQRHPKYTKSLQKVAATIQITQEKPNKK